jgi:integrase
LLRPAPETFDTKRAADRWLVDLESEMNRGTWLDPDAGRVQLGEYATRWVSERDLKKRTREEYERIVRLHIVPCLGARALVDVSPPIVRSWRGQLREKGVGEPTVAKSYRILHAIFATAIDDDLARRNPCRIRGASQEKAAERPTVTLEQAFAIAAAIQPRYRLLVLLAVFAQLRFGELMALRRRHIDLVRMEVRVVKATSESDDGTQEDDDPKSDAGKRTTAMPGALRTDIEWHLARFAQPGPDGRLFVGPSGGIPRRRNFNRIWRAALHLAGDTGRARPSPARPASHRKHLVRADRSDVEGSHGTDRPLLDPVPRWSTSMRPAIVTRRSPTRSTR